MGTLRGAFREPYALRPQVHTYGSLKAPRLKKGNKMTHPHKRRTQTGDGSEINEDYIAGRYANYMKYGYTKMPKWMLFASTMLRRGFRVKLYEAKRTVSKYVTVLDAKGKKFKVRFSDHKPIPMREFTGDCDFFVGRNNWETNTTNDALKAALQHFGEL